MAGGVVLLTIVALPIYVYNRPKLAWRAVLNAETADLNASTDESAAAGNPEVVDEQLVRDQITDLASAMDPDPAHCSATDLYGLGRLYALLFDATADSSDRNSALNYMTAAAEKDPSMFQIAAFFGGDELESFGSLEKDPDFKGFVTQ